MQIIVLELATVACHKKMKLTLVKFTRFHFFKQINSKFTVYIRVYSDCRNSKYPSSIQDYRGK
jgi:hypothetical protein